MLGDRACVAMVLPQKHQVLWRKDIQLNYSSQPSGTEEQRAGAIANSAQSNLSYVGCLTISDHLEHYPIR